MGSARLPHAWPRWPPPPPSFPAVLGAVLSLPGLRRSGPARLLPCPLCLSHPRLSFPGSLPARPHLPGNGLMSHHLPGVTDYAAAPALPGSQGPPAPPLRLLPLAGRNPKSSCKRNSLCEPSHVPPLLPAAPLPPAAHWPQPQFKGTSDLTGNRKPWERDGTDKALSCFREKSTSSPTRTHMSARLRAAQALCRLVIQMETGSFEARCCLRTPLKGPSAGINQRPLPRAGVAAVAPRSGRVRHHAAVVRPGARPPATLPQPRSLLKCQLTRPGRLTPTL